MIAEISETVIELVEAIAAAGLREAYFSIEPEMGPTFTAWLIDRGYVVAEAEWNAPESLYVGVNKPVRPLTVFSVRW